ncbi:transketolase [Salibacterium qingdaonense]|uniref:Transketolase n=1 Tax=Salibacterium qingdaonense TaxID=266892 RepID=A0A1I4P1V3_9BACI|nr:transketolase [Salibacterium qingdaonense]SFM21626.1 transketolase [Salibacterium qingdaonense]
MTSSTLKNVEQETIQTIRMLSVDSVEKAQSGHPGMPMGAAPMAYVLWSRFLKKNPGNPSWKDRDRFILSAGHGSMLQYSLLHLFGYDVTMDDLKSFRQWDSKTPGHPEVGDTPGIEATTGPLGQGIAMSVGMALAESHLASVYNRPDFPVVDHWTYAICSDGDLMEGISHEAAALAGHLGLGKLVWLYDSNDISLDGDLDKAYSDDTQKRFESYGWQVLYVEDGNDTEAVETALQEAKKNTVQPTLIEVKTIIGFGAPTKGGSSASHGAPLGEEEIEEVKKAYGWTQEEPFYVPETVRDHMSSLQQQAEKEEEAWNRMMQEYRTKYPELYESWEQGHAEISENLWDSIFQELEVEGKKATRGASGEVIQSLASHLRSVVGGSADLASSNKTMIDAEEDMKKGDYSGRNIWFGVREFGMGAALNGMALHGGLHMYGGTFLTFSDYMRSAIRTSAIMKNPVTYVFTHDSIAVGEDGPTHQPVEHIASLRAMPNVNVLRPADAKETAAAWKTALSNQSQPSALIFSRQKLPSLPLSLKEVEEGVSRGAYIVSQSDSPDLVLLASGSEVSLALEAAGRLKEEGFRPNVVSMPSWDLFEQQTDEYKKSVIPPDIKKRAAFEMASPLGWHKYTGDYGYVFGIETFGASAPGDTVVKEYGFTAENAVKQLKRVF